MNEIYNRIKLETKKKGLNGKDIAILLGLKKSPLTDWKNGQSLPTTEQIIKLCEFFAVSSDYLLFGSTNKLAVNTNKFVLNFQKLSEIDQKEILNLIDYKLYMSEKKETSLPLDVEKKNNFTA